MNDLAPKRLVPLEISNIDGKGMKNPTFDQLVGDDILGTILCTLSEIIRNFPVIQAVSVPGHSIERLHSQKGIECPFVD